MYEKKKIKIVWKIIWQRKKNINDSGCYVRIMFNLRQRIDTVSLKYMYVYLYGIYVKKTNVYTTVKNDVEIGEKFSENEGRNALFYPCHIYFWWRNAEGCPQRVVLLLTLLECCLCRVYTQHQVVIRNKIYSLILPSTFLYLYILNLRKKWNFFD